MKRIVQYTLCTAVALAILGGGIFGCTKEGPAEKAGKKIDKAAEQAGEQMDKAADKIRDFVK